MKRICLSLLVVLLTPSVIFGITRDQVVGNAYPYFLVWRPLVDSCWILTRDGDTIPPIFRSYFKVGVCVTSEAYVWGGVDDPDQFLSRINDSVCPGGYGTSQYGYYVPGHPEFGSAAAHWLAGIDCAAFVNRCLQLTAWQGIKELEKCCLKIDKKIAKKGDVLTKPHHARLVVENNYPMAYVFESISQEPWEPRVRGAPVSMAEYGAYSIFPQFANELPANGSEVYEKRPEISLEVTGSGFVDIVYMLVDGEGISFNTEPIQNGIKVTGELQKDLEDGKHTVEVYAMNTRVRPYEDWFDWSFEVRAELPVVVATDPRDGEENVDVYEDFTITFNKEMNTGTVNSGTVLFNPPLVGAFTPEWTGDKKTVTLKLDPEKDLEFITNYTVILTEDIKDKDGTMLDGNKDGVPGGNDTIKFKTREPRYV